MFYGLYYALLYYFWDYPIDTEPSASSCFFPCFSVSQKRNIKRSRNGMKPSGEVIFGKKAIRGTWSARQESNEGGTRQGSAPTLPPYTLKRSGSTIDREFRRQKPR